MIIFYAYLCLLLIYSLYYQYNKVLLTTLRMFSLECYPRKEDDNIHGTAGCVFWSLKACIVALGTVSMLCRAPTWAGYLTVLTVQLWFLFLIQCWKKVKKEKRHKIHTLHSLSNLDI